MIPMISFLVDTAIAYDDPEAISIVHEWGVVVFQQDDPIICGGPWSETGPINDACAEAPVIWIHGEPFSGNLEVALPGSESFTFLYPEPSSLEDGKVNWSFSAGMPQSLEEALPSREQNEYDGPFRWALPFWRSVPSLPLHLESGMEENFLYYECTVSRGFTENFFQWGNRGNPVFITETVGEALYFTPSGVFIVQPGATEFLPLDLPVAGETNPDFAREIFCRWGGSRFKTEEIDALWETWRQDLTGEGSYWIVFPIPAEFHEGISSIELTTDIGGTVAVERLFLGAVKLNRT